MRSIFSCVAFVCLYQSACAQAGQRMDFEKYEPASTLVVAGNPVRRAKFPFIDVHSHQWNMNPENLNDLISEMDKLNMAVMVNLSGRGGNELKESSGNVRKNYPKRFIVFANINFDGIGESGWTERTVKALEEDVKNGANGLKIFKNLG